MGTILIFSLFIDVIFAFFYSIFSESVKFISFFETAGMMIGLTVFIVSLIKLKDFLLSLILGIVSVFFLLILKYWYFSLELTIIYFIDIVWNKGLISFIIQDLEESLFPLRIASLLITFQIGYLTYKIIKKEIVLDKSFNILKSYIPFQYLFYLLTIIFLWELNSLELSGHELAILKMLNWAVFFILDDFIIITAYSTKFNSLPFKWHSQLISVFNIIIFTGTITLVYNYSFDTLLNIIYICTTIVLVFIKFDIFEKYKLKKIKNNP